jgi:hypothetical protein
MMFLKTHKQEKLIRIYASKSNRIGSKMTRDAGLECGDRGLDAR